MIIHHQRIIAYHHSNGTNVELPVKDQFGLSRHPKVLPKLFPLGNIGQIDPFSFFEGRFLRFLFTF